MFEFFFVVILFVRVVEKLFGHTDSASDDSFPFSENGSGKFAFDTDDMFPTQTSMDFSSDSMKPIANIDGTPMFGDIDAHGNPFGVTSSWE